MAACTAFLVSLAGCQANKAKANPPGGSGGDSEYERILLSRLEAEDPETRHQGLRGAMALGWSGRDLVLQALEDRAATINRTAQTWFVDQGEYGIDYLGRELKRADPDRGIHARIAGGVEEKRGRSIAGTLWMTVVRGIPRDRMLDVMVDFAENGSPRVRAVALFAAASLRAEEALEVLERLADDPDPVVRRQLRDSLVRLLLLDWYSTPELDEATTAQVLSLLEPELTAILNDDEPSGIVPDATLGEILGRDVPFHRDRLSHMVESVLPQLTETGAARGGAVIARQCWTVPDRDRYLNALWSTEASWDRRCLVASRGRLLQALDAADGASARSRYVAALSGFPAVAFDGRIARLFLDQDAVQQPWGLDVVEKVVTYAEREGEEALREEAVEILAGQIASPEDKAALHGALVGLRLMARPTSFDGPPASGAERTRARLETTLRNQSDRLFGMRGDVDVRSLCSMMDLFARLEDQRYVALFEEAWTELPDEELANCISSTSSGGCISSRRDEDLRQCLSTLLRANLRLALPHVVEYATEQHEAIYTGLKGYAVANLVNPPLGDLVDEWLTDEVFERILAIVRDPEQHPRVRANWAFFLKNPHLGPERRKALQDAFLWVARPPHGWNVQSKALWYLGATGDGRALPLVHLMLMSEEAPMWVHHNGLRAIFELETGGNPSDLTAFRSAVHDLIDVLGTLVALNPESGFRIGIVQESNSYAAVQYRRYPPFLFLQQLRDLTGQDFGYDIERWREWVDGLEQTDLDAIIR